MNISFWKKVASLWCDIRSSDDIKKTETLVLELLEKSTQSIECEKSLVDVLLNGLDEEDDDGY